jgi:hypothetical protein
MIEIKLINTMRSLKLMTFRMLLLGIAIFMLASPSMGQAPEAFNYQGIALDAKGVPVASKKISLRVSILQETSQGAVVMQETHSPTTDKFGQFSVNIGEGNSILGKLSNVKWGNFSHFLKTEIDIAGGVNFIIAGVSQLLSVPYALFSAESSNKYVKVDTVKRNTGFGDSLLLSNTTGIDNLAVGYASLSLNTTGRLNTSVGNYSLNQNKTGSNNSVFGVGSLNRNTSGSSNTVGGVNAMYFNSTGNFNTSIGNSSLYQHPSGTGNSSIGFNSMYSLTSGNFNTSYGYRSFYSPRFGNNNVAVGYQAGNGLDSGSNNIFIGPNAGNNASFSKLNNKLVISNSTSNRPLIYGDFDNQTMRINGYLDSPVVWNMLGFEDAYANDHINKYEIDKGPLIYGRYFFGQYGDLIIQGQSRVYTGNIHFVTGSNVTGADAPTQRLVIMANGKVGIGNFNTQAPRAKLEVQDGDVYISNPNKGIIMTSPNGNCWRVTMDNNGNFVRTQISCPTYNN